MVQVFVFINFWVLALSSQSWADAITMTADSDRVTLGESLSLQVTVEGFGRNSDVSLTQVADFEVQKSGTSSQISIVNGKMASSTISQFILYPKKAGKFRIGPAEIESKGQVYKSNVIEVTVIAETTPTQKANAPYYVQATVDRTEVVVGEPIIYTFQLFTKTSMSINSLSEIAAPTFYKEELEKPHEYRKIINGVPWNVVEFKKVFYPLKAGTQTLEPTVLTAMVQEQGSQRKSPFRSLFDDGDLFSFGRRTKRVQLQTQPIVINVQSLPESGKPVGFSGLIGQFTLDTQIDKTQLKMGDSATLTLTFRGKGNLKDLKIPELQSETLKTYDDEPTFEISKEDNSQIKVFKRALVPTQDGQIAVPPIKIDYYDSDKKSYATLETAPLTLEVSPNAEESTLKHIENNQPGAEPKKSIVIKGSDIFPIKQTLKNTNPPISKTEKFTFWLLLALTPLCYFIPLGLRRRLAQEAGNLGLKRKSRAYKNFAAARKQLKKTTPSYERLSLILRDYLGDKFDIDGRALTSSDVRRRLEGCGVSQPVALQVETLIKEFEAGQFSGKSLQAQDQLMSRLDGVVQSIERELR